MGLLRDRQRGGWCRGQEHGRRDPLLAASERHAEKEGQEIVHRAPGYEIGSDRRHRAASACWISAESPDSRAGRAGPVGASVSSKTPQEVDEILLLRRREPAESKDHGVGLRRRDGELSKAWEVAVMREDRLQQIRRPSVVKKEEPLAEPPEGRRSKLISLGLALNDPVGESRTHMVQQEVGEEIHLLVLERRDRRGPRGERRRVAEGAADDRKERLTTSDGIRTARRIRRRLRRRPEPHEEGEFFDVTDENQTGPVWIRLVFL